jgi:hypothetical protein
MAVQFKSPTDKIKRVTGFQWTEEGVLVLDASDPASGSIYSTEDGDEFTNRGRAHLGLDANGLAVGISKITYHIEQEGFFATTNIFDPTEPATVAGGIIGSDDGGETWQSVYENSSYYIGRWIAYDDENERLRAIVARPGDGFESDLNGFVNRHLQSADGLSWSTIGQSTTHAGALEFMFAETITCELTDPQNPSQHFTAYVRMMQPSIVHLINNPSQVSRLTTVQISRNRQSWTTVDTGLNGGGFEAGVNCLAAADGGDVLIACGGGGIAATLNGVSWSRVVTTTGSGDFYMRACGFVGEQFIALGEEATGPMRLWRSVDGFEWESESLGEALSTADLTGSSGALSSPFTAQ